MELAANDTSLSNSDPYATDPAAGPNPSARVAADTHAPGKENGGGQRDAERIAALFKGCELGYGTYRQEEKTPGKVKSEIKKTASTIRGPTTIDLWEKHLSGERSLGIIPIREDGTCYWGVIDVDMYDLSHRNVAEKVKKLGLPLVLCKSKSGGAHLFVFLSEPVSAAEMMARLREWAAMLGYGSSEIFPKQTKLLIEKGDLGNWLNMPYFDAEKGNRYAVNEKGQGLSLKRFLEAAEAERITAREFTNFKPKTPESPPDFGEGPPCLQHLSSIGVEEGGRNNAMFAFGVLAKKMKPDGWEPLLESWNQKHISPPLSSDEVQIIIKSLRKKEYTYKCKEPPICNHCDRSTCLTRKFGVTDGKGDSKQSEAEFEKWLRKGLTRLECSAPGIMATTLATIAIGVGRWSSVLDLDFEAVEARLRASWVGAEDVFGACWNAEKFEQGRKQGNPPTAEQNEPMLVSFADVEPQPIEWLWKDRLAIGKLTTLAGESSLGKSQLTMFMAAMVTTGGLWPLGEGRAPMGKVLVLSAEDDLQDTIVPRFLAAGGNPENIVSLNAVHTAKGERMPNLEHDIEPIGGVLSTGNFRLVIIDPISAYMHKVDQNSNTAVRGMLAPLQHLAEKHRVAVVLIQHLVKNKTGRKALDAVNGSTAFTALSRIYLLATRDEVPKRDDKGETAMQDTGWRNVTTGKINIAKEDSSGAFRFKVIDSPLPNGIPTSKVGDFERITMTADEAVGYTQRGPGRPADALDVAIKFLRAILRDGSEPVSVIKAEAKKQGISEATLENAKRELDVKSIKNGLSWLWALPGRQRELGI